MPEEPKAVPEQPKTVEAKTVKQGEAEPAGDQGRGWTVGLREIMASAIEALVVTLSCLMLWRVFVLGGEANADVDAYSRQKDVMLYGLTLLGTVLGYYFGRVPAERRAEHAEAAAGDAHAAAASAASIADEAQRQAREEAAKKEAAQSKVADAREAVTRIRGQLGSAREGGPLGTRRGPESAPAAGAPPVHAELDALLRRLR